MTDSRKPEDLTESLDMIQQAAFNMADGWGMGLDISYAGVDLTAPMLYGLTTVFNRQLMMHFFPPVQPEVEPEVEPEENGKEAEAELVVEKPKRKRKAKASD